jgi:L(+)-tartrate dehydratase beta subunit
MTHHQLTLPISEQQVRALHVHDTVSLSGTLFGIRDANQIALFDQGRPTRFDLSGAAAIHTAPNVRRVAISTDAPVGYAPLCIGTTTSTRMERFTRPLLQKTGLRLILGKGGLLEDSLAAMAQFGAAYLSVTGGAAALETTWISRIDDVDMDDLHPESLWKFQVHDFGPLLVSMDSHGGNLDHEVATLAASRREAALRLLGIAA